MSTCDPFKFTMGSPALIVSICMRKSIRIQRVNQSVVCGRVPWLYQYWPGGLMVLCFYVQELPKAQQAVVLFLKRLRRRGNSLKSHPTDWEKLGIEPATPGLQDIGLSPTPRRLQINQGQQLCN